jgi:dienelactone hydrolase
VAEARSQYPSVVERCGLENPGGCRYLGILLPVAEVRYLTDMSGFAPWLRARLKLAEPASVETRRKDRVSFERFDRETIEYCGDAGDAISAFLFTPAGTQPLGGVVVFHQHNGEFHIGKSEVAGLAGSKLQAFGPALAQRGVAVLAPDAITFEDRRTRVTGTEPHVGDWQQHYNAMAYRLVNGDLVMRKALDDAQRAVSVLLGEARVDPMRVGVSGHSYGGTTAMYLAAVDRRCRFACLSGAVSSFAARQRNGTGISMFELVPGIAAQFEIQDVVGAIEPRDALIVSGTGDPYSIDANDVAVKAGNKRTTQLRVEGGHELDQARFDKIVDWLVSHATGSPERSV